MQVNEKSEIREILNQQRLLKKTREIVSKHLNKHVCIISGDLAIREMIKGYLETLGYQPEKIKATNSSASIINRIKQQIDNTDLIICHLKTLDSRVSSQTGLQLLTIIRAMLLTAGADRTIPFIFAEKVFERKDILAACKAGVSQFLILPADPISMGNKLSEVFVKPEESLISKEVTKLLIEGNRLQEQGLFEQAVFFYNKALKIGGENSDVLMEKANALLNMGEAEQAIQTFMRVTEIETNFPRAHQGLGATYEQLGDFEKAKYNYKKVLELEPHNVQVHYNLGAIYQDEGDFDEAGIYFEKGIGLNKRFIKNYMGLAKNYEARDNPKKSLEVYKKAMEFNPNQTYLYLTVGDFCLKHNLDQEAEDVFSEGLSFNEKHIHLYNRLGIALRKQQKYKEALLNFNKALRIKPKDPNLNYNLAKAYYLNGDDQSAIKKLNQAFQLDPLLRFKFEEDSYFSKLMEKYPDKFSFE